MTSKFARRSILVWPRQLAWTSQFVSGEHDYLVPRDPEQPRQVFDVQRFPRVREVDIEVLSAAHLDLVVVQHPDELALTTRWLGRRPGIDIPAVYVEHHPPRPFAADSMHPVAGRDEFPLVHLTDFNRVMWNNGMAPNCVITPAVADPGAKFTGDVPAVATIVDEPMRRVREAGVDLLAEIGAHSAVDLWGNGSEPIGERFRPVARLRGRGPAVRPRVLEQLGRRRAYVHTPRWTSLDTALMEAMYVGLPIVAFASTAIPTIVPPEAGVVSADVHTLALAARGFVVDHAAATAAGKAARDYAVAHFGVERFHAEWNAVITELTNRG